MVASGSKPHQPLKEWENPTETAAWRRDGAPELPYKGFAPLHHVPGCHEPKYILLDFLHIYHIGYGFDATASSIVLLAKLGQFGDARKLDDRLAEAYYRFDLWCKINGRFTTIDEFTSLSFGMGENLG